MPRPETMRAPFLLAMSCLLAACGEPTVTASGGSGAGGRSGDGGSSPLDPDFYTRPDDGGAGERTPRLQSPRAPQVFGGDSGTPGPAGAPPTTAVCRMPGAADPALELIDDFEDGTRDLPRTGDRTGYWSSSHDSTATGIHTPEPFTLSEIAGCADRLYAHVRGTGFVRSGAILYFYFAFDGAGYDVASKYAGITFWARSTNSARMRVALPNKDTDSTGRLCSGSSGNNACGNHFGQDIALTSSWASYRVTFADLRQQAGVAGRTAPRFDGSAVYRVNFAFGPNVTYDLWLDDVAFVPR